MSFWGKIGLQEGTSVLGVEIQCLYDHIMLVMVMIFAFVSFMMLKVVVNSFFSSKYEDNQLLETVWTFLPVILLFLLGFPSIKLLYLMDELELPEATIKVIGHQWYWSYEYSDVFGSTYGFDSYMKVIPEEERLLGDYRLLEVDSRGVIAAMLHMRALITSEDVMHSWAIPSASIKVDAIPGRINQIGLCFLYTGVFYGQCSELCGINHSFMPICVEAVSVDVFTDWIIGNHNANTNSNAGGSSYWQTIVYYLFKSICHVYDVIVFLGKLYYWWWEAFVYYGIYVPIKYTFQAGVDLIKWTGGVCVSLVKWVGWFLVSPVDATVYAVTYVSVRIYEGVWYAVTKPFEFSFWLVKSVFKSIYKTVSFLGSATTFLFNSAVSSMSSFTDDSFKQSVVEEVNTNTFKFLWIIENYYKGHK